MKSNNFEKSRLTVLREMLGLSQKDFADNVGITQGALSQLETGKSRLSLDSLQKISLAFKANCNWLVNGKGDIFMKEITKNKVPVRQSILTVDIEDTALVPLVLEEAYAGYINGCQDTDYLSTLDVYKIPGYENGNYRLFEINGDSMIPTIYPREIVVSECVEDWENIENGTLAIVITEDGIVAKRTYFYEEDRNMLILKSDNSSYKTYSINLDDVREIWTVRAKITNVFAQEQTMDAGKLETLEADLKELKAQMKSLNTHKRKNGN
ncbi:LexA family transcriptional regulator [Fulvivirga sp. M361]|uniref:XRE family transcriptional regulator n=1 Tax=Fulvivirga sp. M361 TaxID=2594266 RepID=UPI00117B75BE|nr:LexA family transcriptional regulator [Fulvivirga sp. M361]TRX60535.1 LexA family transcriptional regulator [Fulvivirga sp. M361]